MSPVFVNPVACAAHVFTRLAWVALLLASSAVASAAGAPIEPVVPSLAASGSPAASAHADVVYAVLDLDLLEFPDGPPEIGAVGFWPFGWRTLIVPYARLDGAGEIYLVDSGETSSVTNMRESVFENRAALRSRARVAVRVPAGEPLQGELFLPAADWSPEGTAGYTRHRFRLPEPADPQRAMSAFEAARSAHYRALGDSARPGGAWFRRAAEAPRRSGEAGEAGDAEEAGAGGAEEVTEVVEVTVPPRGVRPGPETELERSFDLYTGGRALSENLQLDAVLADFRTEGDDVPLAEIAGIETQTADWAALIADLKWETDPLARWIPHDQHALFCSSFGAFVDLADEFAERGREWAAPTAESAEDAGTRRRYEVQLCVELDALARALGAHFVDSVAITGSDAYLRTGSDVALLFEASTPTPFVRALWARQDAARALVPEAELSEFDLAGARVRALVSPDRRLSSYVAAWEQVVVVANSRVALERIASVQQGATPALADLDEYGFFRARYPRSAPGETAFLMLSDATIRRWCGPRWRIASSRRVRAAAYLADLEARALMAELVAEPETDGAWLRPTELPVAGGGALTYDADARGAARSELWNTLAFQTPIAEVELDRVSAGERAAYDEFKRRYQLSWRQFFDPIGVSLHCGAEKLACDLTVLPLIAGSEYRELMEAVGEEVLEEEDGDPHPEILAQYVMALDIDGPAFRQLDGMLNSFLSTLNFTPLSWVGDYITVYADGDPIWDELETLDDAGDFFQEHLGELPIAVVVDVADPLRLAAFLTAVRGLVDSSAPNLLRWQNHEHEERGYVEIEITADLLGRGGSGVSSSLFYASLPDRLIVALGEDVLLRAMERAAGPRDDAEAGAAPDAPVTPIASWAGQQLAFHASAGARPIFERLFGPEVRDSVRRKSWRSLAILDEWHERFGAEDATAFHAGHWGVELYDPAGGRYVWDEEWQTYGSTVTGHPAAPRALTGLPGFLERVVDVELGLAFEHDGLRARFALEREGR